MVKVQRGNVVLTISDNAIDRYMNMGYDVVDEKGNVKQISTPTDLKALQHAYVNNAKTIKELQARIEELEEENEALKTGKEPAQTRKGRAKKETSEEMPDGEE